MWGLQDFIRRLKQYGLEYLKLYYGIYKAKVVRLGDNLKDGIGTLFISVPSIAGTEPLTAPAYPIYPYAGQNKGVYYLPAVNDYVWVVFEGGKLQYPRWIGGWFSDDEFPDTFKGTPQTSVYAVRTANGNQIKIDDETGTIEATASDNTSQPNSVVLTMSKDGRFTVEIYVKGKLISTSFISMQANQDGTSSISLSAAQSANASDSVTLSLLPSGCTLRAGDKGSIYIDRSTGNMKLQSDGNITLDAKGIIDLKSGLGIHHDGASASFLKAEALMAWLNSHVHTITSPTTTGTPLPVPPSVVNTKNKM
jgi:hypothetical protein